MPDIGKMRASCNKNEGCKVYQYGTLSIFDNGKWKVVYEKGCNDDRKTSKVTK